MTDLAPSEIPRWNAFVAACPYGDVLQTWEWGQLKARTGWEPLYVSVAEGHRLAASALVLKRRIPRTRRCLFYCPRGPIFDPQKPEALEELMRILAAEARFHGAVALQADPALTPADQSAVAALRAAGLRPAAGGGEGFGGVQPKAVMKVDISRSEEEILESFHQKWRYNIRLAGRKGVVLREDCGPAEMDAFYDLLTVTARRDGFGIRARSYFHDLNELILQRGLGKLVLATVGNVPISGAICFLLGRQCWYVYGASDNDHRTLMPNHLLQWEMMRWAKSQGCTVYDMRGVAPEVGGEATEESISGLNRFKRGFGAEYVEYVGELDLIFSPFWYGALKRLLPLSRRLSRRG